MLSIVFPEPGRVELHNVETPVMQPGGAILKLLYGGICGSDLNAYKNASPYAKFPLVPGHEFSAEIIEIGPNERGLRQGMQVTANPYFNCGSCYSCVRGHVNCCQSNQTMGAQRDGAFSEYVFMPVSRIIDGRGLDPRTLALIEPYCIGYHAALQAHIRQGDKVLVIGAGAIGCFSAIASQFMGGDVTICDIAPFKLENAKRLGVKNTCLKEVGRFQEQVEELTDGRGFDVCIEAVGIPETFQNCVDAAAFCGRVVVVGIGKKTLDFFYSIIQTKELTIVGSRNALTADFEKAIEDVVQGRLKLDTIISKTFDFHDAKVAFEELASNSDQLLKVMIKF